MSNYNWCHGPNCHTYQTQSRIRGSGDNKVLRTIKIKQGRYNYYDRGNNQVSMWDYFCNQSCLMDFIRLHLTSIVAIAPRREALETPIKVEKTKSQEYRMRYNGNDYDKVPYISTRTTIKSVDNA
jgi:YHS domain-containing protein